MSGPTRRYMEEVRAENRRALGLGGISDTGIEPPAAWVVFDEAPPDSAIDDWGDEPILARRQRLRPPPEPSTPGWVKALAWGGALWVGYKLWERL